MTGQEQLRVAPGPASDEMAGSDSDRGSVLTTERRDDETDRPDSDRGSAQTVEHLKEWAEKPLSLIHI